MKIMFPVFLTFLALAMAINWQFSSDAAETFTLWVFGFISGIAVASWIAYIHEH